MARNLALLLCTLVLCYAGAELFFALRLRPERALPLVKFHTEHKNVVLWSYDRFFNGIADYDLRGDIPYRSLRYCCNEDGDPDLADIEPARVPHAIEVVFNVQATRDRDWRDLPPDHEVTLVVGDSFCFGQGVRLQDRFSNLLEKRLNERRAPDSPPQAFLAACYAGADVERVSQAMQNFSRMVRNVRRVIYAYTLNDPIQDQRLRQMQQYIDDFMHYRVRGRSSRLPDPERAATPMLEWFRTQARRRKIASDTIRWYHELHRGPTWERTQQVIFDMHRLAETRNMAFTLVVFPLFHDLDRYPFSDVHERIAAFAQQRGIELVDLLEAFRGRDEQDFWVHPKDFHPNHRGHARAAQHLLERIDW